VAQATGAAADWLYHHLTISGPADGLQNFAAAARGSGVTPWQLDFAALEEDVFVRAVAQPASQRTLTVEGCRILARQFRQRVEMRQARASELVGQSFVCPFDLHALRPVPGPILQRGPRHPDAVAWLAAHLGHHRPAAPGGHPGQGDDGPAAAATPRGDRLRVLYRWRNPARGGRIFGKTLAGAAVLARAAGGGLSRAAMHQHAATPAGEPDAADMAETVSAPAADDGQAGREGGSPHLMLDGFSGPLETLLTLARAQRVDLSRMSLTALLDQLTAALQQASNKIPLGQQGDWVVMAAWLVQLRARLLLPADAPAQQDAAAEADTFRGRLVALDDIQALAQWLERRPQLGHDVFARGQPEILGHAVAAGQAIDVVEFLWASLALFDDETTVDTTEVYRARPFALYAVAEARDRILRLLAGMPGGGPLDQFLPDLPADRSDPWRTLRRRSGWASTFIASLELAKQGDVALAQEGPWTVIAVQAGGGERPLRQPVSQAVGC
jgi:segregation and condensation protein A